MRFSLLGLLALTVALAACDSGSSPATASVRYAVSGPATITFTDASGASSSATASAAWDREVALAAGAPVALAAQSTSGQPVTATITVDGQLSKSSRGTNVRISTSPSSSSAGEVEVEGPIEALSATSITVLGISFSLDAGTAFLDDNNDPTTVAAFAVGTRVEVKGRSAGGGAFRATRVKPDDDSYDDDGEDGQEIELHGPIQAIDATSVTVQGRVFVTSASTRYLDDDNNAIPRSAFQVGEFVEAEGHVQADGTVRAEKIKRDDD